MFHTWSSVLFVPCAFQLPALVTHLSRVADRLSGKVKRGIHHVAKQL